MITGVVNAEFEPIIRLVPPTPLRSLCKFSYHDTGLGFVWKFEE